MPTINVNVDVDVDVVLEDIDTKHLVRELRSRAKETGEASLLDEVNQRLSAWDIEKLREAVKNDDGHRVIDILAPVMFPDRSGPKADKFAKLPRDPATGRPVIQ